LQCGEHRDEETDVLLEGDAAEGERHGAIRRNPVSRPKSQAVAARQPAEVEPGRDDADFCPHAVFRERLRHLR
jgi:hypothetical protein